MDLIRFSSGCSSASRWTSCRVVIKKNTDLSKTYVRILLAILFVSSTRLLELGRLINYRLEQNMCRVCSSRFYQRSRHSQKRLFDALVGRACHLQHADAPNEFPLNHISKLSSIKGILESAAKDGRCEQVIPADSR
ncbi:unnamed protein product [Albugo candida]|uniref:Uncharacterized protein n=1 Tax=Albugo candida TaxID=65357 RepID=A0A024GN37_9STRA|nr:unnamed protein product [Albugo candida]|eukprot:CCI47904.1 unnamed protein product [Albugo candida]